MNKQYITEYLNIITEFNDTLSKWVKYQNYKQIEIYIDRDHILDRFNNNTRSSEDLISYYNLTILKYLIKKFLKINISNLKNLIQVNNQQSFFFIVTLNINSLQNHLYFTGELQYNKNKECYQFGASTFLPNIYNGQIYTPSPNKNDIIINLTY